MVKVALSRDKSLLDDADERRLEHISWDPGPEDWLTMNTDGSVNPQTRKATTGGLLRDWVGWCHFAFTMNLGDCSITRAELHGAIRGLEIVWDKGYKRVFVQLDSLAAVSLLNNDAVTDHLHGLEVIKFRELWDRDWSVVVKHIYREGNHAVDHLAGLGYGYPFGSHMIQVTDSSLVYFFRYDCSGVSELRSILAND
ncbi:Putative ribonuclease H protein At1g65750 [Linum perenne]